MTSAMKERSGSFEDPLLPSFEADPISDRKSHRLKVNAMKLEEDLAKKHKVFQSMPLLLEFSTNNKCNLQCIMCSPKGRQAKSLDPEIVREELVEKLFPDALCLLPSSGSEPFLGDFGLLSEGCVEHEVQLNIITNGVLMTPERMEIVEPAIGRIQVSVDGHRKELYESIRVGAKFEHVTANVKHATELARRKGFALLLSAVFSNELAPELDAYVRFAADLGADAAVFQNIHHTTKEAIKMDAFRTFSLGEISEYKEKAVQVARDAGLDIHFDFNPPFVAKFNPRIYRRYYANHLQHVMVNRFPHICFMSATYVNINPDGFVYPCCVAPAQLKMGNIKRHSFAEIWNGRKYRNFRRAMFKRSYPKPCRNCKQLARGAWALKKRKDWESSLD